MKNSLLKKLFTIIVASAQCTAATHAQIIYTNIPDATISKVGAIYSLDLNNDGIKDYEFHIDKSSVTGIGCKGKKTNYGITIYPLNGNESNSVPLPLNSIIDSSGVPGTWSDYSPQGMAGSGWVCWGTWAHLITGNWLNVNDQYLGLKLHAGSTVYFGWALCSASIDNTGTELTLTIKDYAYNRKPNQSILAGQTSAVATQVQKKAVINDEDKIDKVRISNYPNPFSNSTTISFSLTQSEKVSIRIFDMTGRLVKVLANTEMQAGTHQLGWNSKDEKGNAVSAGIYLLKLGVGNYAETKKILVIR